MTHHQPARKRAPIPPALSDDWLPAHVTGGCGSVAPPVTPFDRRLARLEEVAPRADWLVLHTLAHIMGDARVTDAALLAVGQAILVALDTQRQTEPARVTLPHQQAAQAAHSVIRSARARRACTPMSQQ